MQDRNKDRVSISPKYSTCLSLFFFFVYNLSFWLTVLVHVVLWLHLFLGVFIIIHGIYIFYRYVFLSHPYSIKYLWWQDHQHWGIQYKNAHIRFVQLLQARLVFRYFILLAFKKSGSFFPVILPLAFDSDSSENMYLLRRRLIQQRSAL